MSKPHFPLYKPEEGPLVASCISKPFGCGRLVRAEEIESWDSLTRTEWGISQLCNVCQDEVFACDEECGCDDE